MISTIATIAEKKKFSDRSDHVETTFQRSYGNQALLKDNSNSTHGKFHLF